MRRGARQWWVLGGIGLVLAGTGACAAVLGFDDLKAGGADPATDTGDGSSDGASSAELGAPSGVIATAGVVTTFAGTGENDAGDGPASAATFTYPVGVAVDNDGNVYVADAKSHAIRKITQDGVVTTLAGQVSSANQPFDAPAGIAVNWTTREIYVADSGNHTIWRLQPDGGTATLAGTGEIGTSDGTGANATFYAPSGVAFDGSESLVVADTLNHRIRKVSLDGGITSTIAGADAGFADGVGTNARFNSPVGVTYLKDEVHVAVSDTNNSAVRLVEPSSQDVNTVSPSGTFANPSGMAVDAANRVYVADPLDNRVRVLDPTETPWKLLASYGNASGMNDARFGEARFDYPAGVAVDPQGNVIYVADRNNRRVRRISVAGTGELVVTWRPPPRPTGVSIAKYVVSATGAASTTTAHVDAPAFSCKLTGLTSGTSYMVQVRAVTSTGASGPAGTTTGTPD